jgi:cobalt-zinc-cadmium efflux system outer membrane protein
MSLIHRVRPVFTSSACLLTLLQFIASPQALAQSSASTQVPAATQSAAVPIAPADQPTGRPTFAQALEAAWTMSSEAKTLASRKAELNARRNAAASLIAGAPSVTLAHRTDRLLSNAGLREYEAEIDVPLWNRRAQSASQQAVRADENLLAPSATASRSKLAFALVALMSDYANSDLEYSLATRKLAESEQLAADTGRRLRAGDVARLDDLQAQNALLLAKSQVASALANKQTLLGQWTALTGLQQVASLPDADGEPRSASQIVTSPQIELARLHVQASEAKLRLAEADQRDPVELGLGLTRERSAAGATPESNLRISLRIPLGNDNRNQPRLTAARKDLAQAQADLETAQRGAHLDIEMARITYGQAQANLLIAQQRAEMAGQAQALIAQAYRLGERDLPARLRADAEKYEADLSAQRARIELRRAAAQLSLNLGQFPS